jgi:Tfp pilus assembly protein FimT
MAWKLQIQNYFIVCLRGIDMLIKSKRKKLYCKQTGFSLMELCVIVAIICIIAAIGIPNFLGMRERYRLRASATDLLSTIKKAQTEALKRGKRVAVAIDTGAGTCTLFVDDGSGAGGVAHDLIKQSGEQLISISTVQTGFAITHNTFPAPPGNLEFNSVGIPDSGGSIDIEGSADLKVKYQVNLSVSGHVDLFTSTYNGSAWSTWE